PLEDATSFFSHSDNVHLSLANTGKDGKTSAATDSNDQDQESFPYDAEDPGEESDAPEARDGAVSPEELNDDDTSGESENVPKTCIYDGCTETTTQVAKARKPWMCKKHRNKMYKDKYKKKKSDQAMSSGKLDVRNEASEERPVSVTKQRLGTTGDRPARPSLIEQVLNQKRLSLLRSPEVISFLQQQQRLLTTQNRAQTQHNY
uniref:Regulatory factor X-associated protein n=1 Tax=Cyprinus carpio TaxID=7962 RepID=A0A8C1IV00_CYPCA